MQDIKQQEERPIDRIYGLYLKDRKEDKAPQGYIDYFKVRKLLLDEIDLAVKEEKERINKFCIEEIEYIQDHSSGNYADGMVESLLKVKRFNQQ